MSYQGPESALTCTVYTFFMDWLLEGRAWCMPAGLSDWLRCTTGLMRSSRLHDKQREPWTWTVCGKALVRLQLQLLCMPQTLARTTTEQAALSWLLQGGRRATCRSCWADVQAAFQS